MFGGIKGSLSLAPHMAPSYCVLVRCKTLLPQWYRNLTLRRTILCMDALRSSYNILRLSVDYRLVNTV
jgi:hypothetical protein